MEHWYALAESLDFRLFTFLGAAAYHLLWARQEAQEAARLRQEVSGARAEYEAKIEDISGLKEQSRDPQRIERQRADVNREFDALDEVAEHPFIAGASYSLADVIWTVSLTRLTFLRQRALIASRPNLAAYFQRMRARPSYEEATLYPHFRIRPMLPLMTRVLGPRILVATAVIGGLALLWSRLTG